MGGWFKVYRELQKKPIWKNSTPEQKVVLMTLLMKATFRPTTEEFQGRVIELQPGQMITSLEGICNTAGKGISIQNVRTALKRFVRLGFITDIPTNKNRLITIINWELYQGDEQAANKQANRDLTGVQQASNNDIEGGEWGEIPSPSGKSPASEKRVDQDVELRELWGTVPAELRQPVADVMKALALTRKTGKMAPSVKISVLRKLLEYEPWKALAGIGKYLDRSYHMEKKGEDYLFGIIRNVTEHEAQGALVVGADSPAMEGMGAVHPMPRNYRECQDMERRAEAKRLKELNARLKHGQA